MVCLNADDTWHVVYSTFMNNELELAPYKRTSPGKGEGELTGDL